MKNQFSRMMPFLMLRPPEIKVPKPVAVSNGFVPGQSFNGTGKTFKRNRRYQIKHGFKAKRN